MNAGSRTYRYADRAAAWLGRAAVAAVALLGLSFAPFAPAGLLRYALAAAIVTLAGYAAAALTAVATSRRDTSPHYFD